MHTVKESGTFTSKDGSKSTQLTAGDQIDEQEAADLGLISAPEGEQSNEESAEQQQQEQKAKPAAPENKSR
jgi:hypothetical protein